jgi:hypothetical protein
MSDSLTLEPPSTRLAAALAGAAVLAACGGTDGRAPAAFSAPPSEAPRRRTLGEAPARTAAAVPTATALMDWAEKAYSGFFPGHQGDLQAPPYVYRYYPATGNYLGVADGRVYILGPVAGSDTTVVDVGAVADFADRVAALTAAADDAMAARFLLQATLGATTADIAAVRSLGYEAWLDAADGAAGQHQQLAVAGGQGHRQRRQPQQRHRHRPRHLAAPVHRARQPAPAHGTGAVGDLRGRLRRPQRRLEAVQAGRLVGPAVHARLRQLPHAAGGGDAERRHGAVPQQQRQPEGEPRHRPPARRELCARGDAAVLHRPARAERRRHAAAGRQRQAHRDLHPGHGDAAGARVHRLVHRHRPASARALASCGCRWS